jgi:hypothetical protein
VSALMTTPQKPRTRLKQKIRRTKQLAEWRAKKSAAGEKKAGAK